MNKTKISWTHLSWNPTHGCSILSAGCKHCYAMELSLKRGWTTKPWTLQNEAENVMMKPHKLSEPYKLKEPQRIFVNSMSDLFHKQIPDWYRAVVFCIMLDLPQHVFQILTKRAEETIDWHERFLVAIKSAEFIKFREELHPVKQANIKNALSREWESPWGSNIWQGVSVEDDRVLHRIGSLQQCKAQTRFISAEPLIGAWGDNVDLDGIHWVIVGGESGRHMGGIANKDTNPRWMKPEWARQIKNLCVDQNVAYFYKQDSGHVTELRSWLIEDDGSLWKWEQYPDDHVPPLPLDDKGTPLPPLFPLKAETHEAYLETAKRYESRLFKLDRLADTPQHYLDYLGITSGYYYGKAIRSRPIMVPPNVIEPDLSPHIITICTAQMGVTDADTLDITIKSASVSEGRALAPTWDLVRAIKDGHINWRKYERDYTDLLRERYATYPDPFLRILERDRIVLKCYCGSDHAECHRHLAVDILEKIAQSKGIHVIRGGEIQRPAIKEEVQVEDDKPKQLSLFDLAPVTFYD